jgi:hypothetical protein
MADEPSVQDHRDWHDYLPWLIIFRALRPAVSFRLLVLSAVGLVGMIAGWRAFWNLLVRPSKNDAGEIVVPDPVVSGLAGSTEAAWPPWPWQTGFGQFGREGIGAWWADSWFAPALDTGAQLTLPFQFLFHRDLTFVGLAYVVLCGVWALAVWSFFGGMITRTAVLRLTRDEPAAWQSVRTFAQSRWTSYFSSPLFPLFGIAVTVVPIAVLGLLARADVGALITGVVWPMALIGGLFMAILLVGLVFGWPLMWSTISAEGTDAFDALSRSYAYVYQRPIHYLFYALVASGVGVIGWCIVHGFAALVIHLTKWAATWGGPAQRIAEVTDRGLESGVGQLASNLIFFWNNVVLALAAAFAVSFFWCGATAIYLLLRRHVDAVELDEVYLDEQEERFGLPPLDEATEDVGDATDGNGAERPAEGDHPESTSPGDN